MNWNQCSRRVGRERLRTREICIYACTFRYPAREYVRGYIVRFDEYARVTEIGIR